MPQKDLTTIGDLESASRGDAPFASDAPSTCYFIHDGTYVQNGTTLALYIQQGGIDATHRRIFVGQSRTGVIIKGRATIDANISHVQLTNLTFDLTAFPQTSSFNTISLLSGSVDLRLDHLTLTGDCATGANGGHVEVDGSSDVIVESCIIEKFGRCGSNGHQDHGVYLASGDHLTIRNNDLRGNSSRGIQFNTEGGSFGTLDSITIELNRIHDNGHADYEDGIVLNATGTGTISNVTIRHNALYGNYYSAIRQVGDVFTNVLIEKNTFVQNGARSSGSGRSEANLDSSGSGAHTTYTHNLFVPASVVLNDCYDATPKGYLLQDNAVKGPLPTGTCVSGATMLDPLFTNAATFDFHSAPATAAGYGAWAP
jgi:hypothetical protein